MREYPPNTKAWEKWFRFETYGDRNLCALMDAAALYLGAFSRTPAQGRWLSLLGPTGIGKTHLALRVWRYIHDRVKWDGCGFIESDIYWPKFVGDLRNGAFDQARDMIQWPVLLLDDIGAERDTTGFATEQLNMLLGARSDKWTILTSNLSPKQIADIEPRIADRLFRQPNLCVHADTISHTLRTRKAR